MAGERMRAVVLTGPGRVGIQDVPVPTAGAGDVVVTVMRVGICGTDTELASGAMPYLATGRAHYPLRPGHEWSGVVREIGAGVDPSWLGARVTGDTMLADGTCDRCRDGRRHVCRDLVEVGISRGFDGALAERLRVPVASLHRLPDGVDDVAGALVEPGGNAWRAAAAAQPGPGRRVLVWGAGTIGLLTTAFAAAAGAEVHVVTRRREHDALARRMGATATWQPDALPGPDLPIHAVVDATDDASVPAAAARAVEPGGRVVLIGLASEPSHIDTRAIVLSDVTVIGLLSGSPGLAAAIERYADGSVDPRPVVGATLGLADAPAALLGERRGSGAPKIHLDPRR